MRTTSLSRAIWTQAVRRVHDLLFAFLGHGRWFFIQSPNNSSRSLYPLLQTIIPVSNSPNKSNYGDKISAPKCLYYDTMHERFQKICVFQ